uniref:MarR family transcriptional regulator n=1 Tax=Fervidobacterium nodosum TaxID=2424 RepID=A0A7C5U5P1_9BACT
MQDLVKVKNDELYTDLEKLLRDVCFRIRVHGREALKNYSITNAQFELLQRIYFNGPQTMTKLSQMLGIAKSTTTGLVMRLERDGFLNRKQDKKDKRISVVEITPLGEEVIKAVINYRVNYIKIICEKMSEENVDKLYKNLLNFFNAADEVDKTDR